MRRILVEAWEASLHSVSGRERVADFLAQHPMTGPVAVFAVGKAAAHMAAAACESLGPRLAGGLVITAEDYAGDEKPPLPMLFGSHPLPDERSLAAGARLLAVLQELPPRTQMLWLISGGASALVEQPSPGVSLEDLRRANDWLLASGRDIHRVNAVRRRLSRIKGGGLLHWLAGRAGLALYLSDVPGNDLAAIGSGPLLAGTPPADAFEGLPVWLSVLLAQERPLPPSNIRHHLLASVETARVAAADFLRAGDLPVFEHEELLQGDAATRGGELARRVAAQPGFHVWAGESTVTLPPRPGRGGRNQHLALAAALALAGQPAVLLAAGSDGCDGVSPFAGAVVTGQTVARARALGWDAATALTQADSASLFAALGDGLPRRVTGTNVMDLVLAWHA